MSTLRVSNIEAKADASSPTIDEKVKVTSSQGRVLVQIDGKTAGITSIGINTTSTSFTIDGNQNVQFVGVITAANVNTTGVSTFTNLVVSAGTTSAPSISPTGDSNTGIFFPSADTIAFAEGGDEAMRITSAGNDGIGTASPGSPLQVEGLITGTAVVSSNTDTTAGRLLTTAAGPAQAFRRGNILGAVSESSGVPTGAIIEEGSNANGNFTKYANGTVIMSMRRTESRSASGTLTTNVTLPLTLSEDVATGRGSVTATVNTSVPQNATSISVNDTDSTTAIEVRILRSNATDTSFYVTLVGRWF